MVPKHPLTILDAITKSSEYLARKGVHNHKTDAEWLVAFSLECKRMDLYLRFSEVLGSNVLERIKSLVMQRASNSPSAHFRRSTICRTKSKDR